MSRTLNNRRVLSLQSCAFNIIIYLIVFILPQSIKCSKPAVPFLNPSDLTLIHDAAEWFPKDGELLKGFEVVVKRFNNTLRSTVFVSKHMQDNQIVRNGSDDTGQKLIILSGESEMIRVPYKNVTTYLVFRQIKSKSDSYTAHLAYVRHFPDEISVEWDLYTFHFHNPNGSLISAFFPIREGPDVVNHGVALEEDRKKRWLTSCGLSIYGVINIGFGCKQDPVKKTPAEKQAIKHQSLIDLQFRKVESQEPQQQQAQPSSEKTQSKATSFKLQWSWITTEQTTQRTPTTKHAGWDTADTTTEFPMYGGSGTADELDENGFTTHPPWSEFRNYEETTEMPDPFAGGPAVESTGPKKICFGLARNCIERATEKPVSRTCPFGLTCKDKNFVDRFAVVTTPSPVKIQHNEIDGSAGGGKKKKKTREECEAEDAARTRRNAFAGTSSPGTPWRGHGRSIQQTGGSPQYVVNINNIICKGGEKCDVGGGGGGGGKEEDPCKKYRAKGTTESPGEASMGFKDEAPEEEVGENPEHEEGKSLIGKAKPKTSNTKSTTSKGSDPVWVQEGLKALASAGSTDKPRMGSGGKDNAKGKAKSTPPPGFRKPENQPYRGKHPPPGVVKGNGSINGLAPLSPPDLLGLSNATNGTEITTSSNTTAITSNVTITDGQPTAATTSTKAPVSNGQKTANTTTIKAPITGGKTTGKRKRRNRTTTRQSWRGRRDIAAINPESNLLPEQKLPPVVNRSQKNYTDLERLELPFEGLGDCSSENSIGMQKPTSRLEVIDFYLDIFKVHCYPSFKSETQKLFNKNLVRWTKESLRIQLNQNHPLMKKKIVGENDWLDISSAIFLSVFSNVYADQIDKNDPKTLRNRSPNGKQLSGTVGTTTLLTFRILDIAKSFEKPHAIKLSNMLLVILQGQRSDLSTAQDELEKCEECLIQKEINFNDQVQLHSLMRIIVDKLGDIVSLGSSTNIDKVFSSFYTENLETIGQRVKNKKPFVF